MLRRRKKLFVDRTTIKNLIFVRLNPGDDLLGGLEKAASDYNIKNAVILCGIGSARSYHFHVVGTRENPPRNDFIKGEKASDIINISGYIIEGRVHAHIAHSDIETAFGGHLHHGVEVLTFAIITLAEVDYNFTGFDSIGNMNSE